MAEARFFDRLNAAERARIESCATRRSYARGDTVFLHGDPAGDVFVVVSGQIKLTLGARDGREVLIEIRGEGEIIGEMALIDQAPRSASGFALTTPTDVLVLSTRDFGRLIDEDLGLTRRLLDEMVRKLRETTFHQLEFGLDGVRGRVARRIDELAARVGRVGDDGTIAFRSPITQQELADWAGVSRQAVVKELSRLRAVGVISTRGSRWVIEDPCRLRARASELSGL